MMFTVITAAALLAEGAFGKDKDCGDGYWVIDTRKRGGSDLGACVNPIDVLTTNQGTCNDGETCSWWTIPANELYYGVQCNDDCVCDQDPAIPDNTFLKLEPKCSVMKNKREVGLKCFGGEWRRVQSWDNGSTDKGSTWMCVKSTFVKRSLVSCQCYTSEGDVQRSLQQSEAVCSQSGACRAISCKHGRTDVCTLRTNCRTILYKNEDCYLKNPQSIQLPNGVIVPLEASPATNAVDSAHVEEGLVAPVPRLLGSSPPQEPQQASRLAQLEDIGTSDLAQDLGTYNVDKVVDGMLVFIYSVKYRYSKLRFGKSRLDCNFSNGDVNENQIWKLQEDEVQKGSFFLVNYSASTSTKTERFTFNPAYKPYWYCYDRGMYSGQLWKFAKTSDGSWTITNQGHGPDCKMVVTRAGDGGVACYDATWKEADSKFRLKPAIDSKAMWMVADSWENNSDQMLSHTFKYSEGITQTITKTIAQSEEAQVSLTIGMTASLEEIGLSASETLSVKQSYSESYARAMQKSWSIERDTSFAVPPHTTMCIKQLKVDNVDNHNNIGFSFSSNVYRVDQGDACF